MVRPCPDGFSGERVRRGASASWFFVLSHAGLRSARACWFGLSWFCLDQLVCVYVQKYYLGDLAEDGMVGEFEGYLNGRMAIDLNVLAIPCVLSEEVLCVDRCEEPVG